jgi:hypothetical protein
VDGFFHTHPFGKRKIGENDYLSLEIEKTPIGIRWNSNR